MSPQIMKRHNQQSIDASFRAKSAGVSLFTILIIGMYFIANVFTLLPSDEPIPNGAVGLIITAVVLIIVVEIVLQIVLFIGAGKIEERTERDDTVLARASRSAYLALTVGVFATAGAMVAGFSPFKMGSVLIVSFLVAETVKFASQIVFHRRSE